ncbi:MAG: hydroxymethylglutaryl-CoA lyase [Firmicutes bacterium]|nr:hydroxymethylglutaryl-CoA lyase [Bacillota bacterium]
MNSSNWQQNQLATPGTIREVGARDGLQNEKVIVPTEMKIALIKRFIDAGITAIEVTSFMSPRAVPQLADAGEVLEGLGDPGPGVVLSALVGNAKGVRRALDTKQPALRELAVVVSASEEHNRANLNRSVEESLRGLEEICRLAADRFKVRGTVSTAFGCPYQKEIKPEEVFRVIEAMLAAGIVEITLGDTAGMGEPGQVGKLIMGVREQFPGVSLALHLHDTRGRGLQNARAGIEAGVTIMESSVGGLGGCPFIPGASGNVATGELVRMMHQMGIDTGVDLDRLQECQLFLRSVLDKKTV